MDHRQLYRTGCRGQTTDGQPADGMDECKITLLPRHATQPLDLSITSGALNCNSPQFYVRSEQSHKVFFQFTIASVDDDARRQGHYLLSLLTRVLGGNDNPSLLARSLTSSSNRMNLERTLNVLTFFLSQVAAVIFCSGKVVCTHMYVLYAQRVAAGYSSVFHSEHVVLKFLNILIKPNNHKTKQTPFAKAKLKKLEPAKKEKKSWEK